MGDTPYRTKTTKKTTIKNSNPKIATTQSPITKNQHIDNHKILHYKILIPNQ